MTKLWLTRTAPAVDESAQAWREAGFDPIVAPLLKIVSVSHEPLPKNAVIIFTSKNGIDHAACAGQRAICVGDVTAEKARTAGYNNVVSVDGISSDITTWVMQNLTKTESIYHVSGWHVRGHITENLQAAGYSAQRIKVYRSIPRPIWPDAPFSVAAFYSPLAAKTFAKQASHKDVSSVSAACISQATADELLDLGLKSILIAKRPREDELIMATKAAL